MKHLIFDLDGTLIDSKPEIILTYQAVFQQIPPEVNTVISEVDFGQTLMTILNALYLNENLKLQARQLFLSLYDQSDYSQTPLYDNVLEVLQYLQTKGYWMYIATNKRLAPTLRILEAKKIHSFFKEVVANEMQPGVIQTKLDMLCALKDTYQITEGIMIGDTHVDMTAAKLVAFKTVAALYGYENRDELLSHQPNYCIEGFKELKELF
jgi:phosphoglycolate phosphatase